MAERHTRYSPLERALLARVVREVADLPAQMVAVFGSRARGHSGVDSDLDVAVRLDMRRSRPVEQRLETLAEDLSVADAASRHRVRVQIVPLFDDDAQGFLAQTIERELDPIWTRT
jgi:predicted nucleotidyltransferase